MVLTNRQLLHPYQFRHRKNFGQEGKSHIVRRMYSMEVSYHHNKKIPLTQVNFIPETIPERQPERQNVTQIEGNSRLIHKLLFIQFFPIKCVFADLTYIDQMNTLVLSQSDAIDSDDEGAIVAAIKAHNEIEPTEPPRTTMIDDDLVDFKKRRYNRPVQVDKLINCIVVSRYFKYVQDFPWTVIKKRTVGQFGLYAKCDIKKGSVVVDYR